MKGRLISIPVVLALAVFALWPAAGFGATLPPPATDQNAAWDGDFIVYSMPFSGVNVQSSPGQIKDGVVIYTGSGGTEINTNFAGMDGAFAAVSGNCNGDISDPDCTFTAVGTSPVPLAGMTKAADPGTTSDFAGDIDNSWDTTMTALLGFLNGSDPLFFFNQNQENAGDAASNFCAELNGGFEGSGGVVSAQDVCVWARVILTNASGPSIVDLSFELEGPTRLFSEGQGPATDGEFKADPEELLLAKGDVCLDSAGNEQLCDGSQTIGPVNHNLGANDVAYLISSPDLNDALALCAAALPGCLWDTMRVQFFLTDLNNGFEQLFMFAEGSTTILTPEPASLILLGAGLIGFGARAWRRRRSA